MAIAINWDSRRCVLGVEVATRESATSCKDFLLGMWQGGLHGVELVGCAIMETGPDAVMHEDWIEDIRYLGMGDLLEHKKDTLRHLDAAA